MSYERWNRKSATGGSSLALSAFAALLVLGLSPRTPIAAQVWEVRDHLLTQGAGVALAQFGTSLAAGDFDGDGDTDLAVGAPNQNATAGFVHLFLSDGESGLTLAAVPTMAGAFSSERYGAALAAGDFNDDGKDELVIGAPGYDAPGPIDQAGRIVVWGYVGAVWTQLASIHQDTTNVEGAAEAMDHFGETLAVGQFNFDDTFDYADLAVGAPGEDVINMDNIDAGAVNVLYGSSTGLTATGDQLFARGGFGVDGTIADNQFLGRALATGNFDSDQFDDLAIGSDDTFGGNVVVLFSDGTALTGFAQQTVFRGDLPQDPGGTGFAVALAAGDFDFTDACDDAGTCADDLLVGMSNATVLLPNMVSVFNAGAAFVLYGSSTLGELDPGSAVRLTQLVLEVPPGSGTGPENGDLLGKTVAAGELGGSASADIAIGAPEEGLTGASLGGGAHVLLSGTDPLEDGLSQGLAPRTGLASAPAEQFDRFGTALAIGDFDDDGFGDLAVGIPFHDVGANDDAGAVQILYGALFSDGFESNGFTNWSNF